jgi:hypothetical protein
MIQIIKTDLNEINSKIEEKNQVIKDIPNIEVKKNILERYVFPVAVFCGGMIGVGFLSLPYVATKDLTARLVFMEKTVTICSRWSSFMVIRKRHGSLRRVC